MEDVASGVIQKGYEISLLYFTSSPDGEKRAIFDVRMPKVVMVPTLEAP